MLRWGIAKNLMARASYAETFICRRSRN